VTVWVVIRKTETGNNFRAQLFRRPGGPPVMWSRVSSSASEVKRDFKRAGCDLNWKGWPHTEQAGFRDSQGRIKWITTAEIETLKGDDDGSGRSGITGRGEV
jgi:hypothetical protein